MWPEVLRYVFLCVLCRLGRTTVVTPSVSTVTVHIPGERGDPVAVRVLRNFGTRDRCVYVKIRCPRDQDNPRAT